MIDDPQNLAQLTGLEFEQALPSGARFNCQGLPLEITFFAPGVIRLKLGADKRNDYGMLCAEAQHTAVEIAEVGGATRLSADGTTFDLADAPLTFDLGKDGFSLLESVTDAHFVRRHRLPPFARTQEGWFVTLNLDSAEPVYGLGEKFGPLNRRGQLVTNWAEDSLGVNAERSYKNCPFAWSPKGWGVFVHTAGKVTHGVGYGQWSHRSYGISVEDDVLDLFFILGDTPAEILERYTHLTGRSPRLPRWSLGVWMSRAYYRTADELLNAAKTLRKQKIPCDVITLDGRAWLDTPTRFAFEWDASRYPDPRAFSDEVEAHDLRICAWEYPLVSVDHPLFKELADKGWLLKTKDGDPYVYEWDTEPFGKVLTPLPKSGLVDFTHPDAYAWFRDSHAKLFDSGISVMKPDFGEQVPTDAVAYNGDCGETLHNAYPMLFIRCVFEATQARFGDDALVWGRSGWTGMQRYPLQWGGDPQADWEGLAGSIRGGLSWGLTGVPFYSHDIGGFYADQRDPELFVRWAQAGVMMSHCRFHGVGEREPWTYDDETVDIVREWLELRYQLIPYLEGCAEQATEKSLPVMRAMVLAFPDDPAAWTFDTQYMLGEGLLIAPVIRPGGKCRVYLPHGNWFDFWSRQVVQGGVTLDLDVPLNRMPVFVRDGTVLPSGPVVQHTGELPPETAIETIFVFGLPQQLPCVAGMPLDFKEVTPGEVRISGLPDTVSVETVGNVSVEKTKAGLAFTAELATKT